MNKKSKSVDDIVQAVFFVFGVALFAGFILAVASVRVYLCKEKHPQASTIGCLFN